MSTLVDRLNRFISSWKQHDQTSQNQHQLQYRRGSSRSGLNTTATTTTTANIEADQLSNASSTSELINISTSPAPHDPTALLQMESIADTDINNNETTNIDHTSRIDIVNTRNPPSQGGGASSNHYYYAITDTENGTSNNNNNSSEESGVPPRLNVGSATAHTSYQIVQLMELDRARGQQEAGGVTPAPETSGRNRNRSGRRRRTSGANNNNNVASSSRSNRSSGGGGGRTHRSAASSSSGRNSSTTRPEVSTTSSSSSSHGRHRHRHNHHHRHANHYDLFSNFKRRERNLLSACCAIFCVAILAVSLVETRWFYLNGGGCNVNHLGVALFFAPGRLETHREFSKINNREITVVNYVLPSGFVLRNCATVEILIIMRLLIAFIFLAIFSSCAGLILDTFGCMRSGMKLVRRHALFHILTVIFCLVINGFCFWISERISEQQSETRSKRGKKIDISFDVSYYLVVLASSLSILATAFTLIRRYPSDEDDQLERLLEEYTNFEEPLLHLERSLPATTNMMPHHHHNYPQHHNAPYRPMYISTTAYQENESSVVAGDCTTGGTYSVINTNPTSRNNNGYLDTVTSSQAAAAAPAPPSTPPPSLLHSINYSQEVTEPPPPYDPTPMHV